jgi:hypothetical protein
VFEAVHSEHTSSPAASIWALWADPGRWPEWDARVASAEYAEPGAVPEPGSEIKVKLHKGGTTRHVVVELEPGAKLVTEYGLPGALAGHSRELAPAPGGRTRVTHRLYVDGPLSGFWALMLGRNRMRDTVAGFTDREMVGG